MNHKFSSVVFAVAGIVFGSMTGVARADIVICPTAVSSTSLPQFSTHGIDGSGMYEVSALVDGAPVPNPWPNAAIVSQDTGDWARTELIGGSGESTADLAKEVITYTLSAPTNITGGHFWNFQILDVIAERSLVSADLYVSANGVDYNYASTLAPGYNNAGKNDGDVDPGVDFAIAANNVSYIQMRNMHNAGSDIIAFGEIRFTGNLVPEPGTLVLFGSGVLGLLAYAWKKRT